MFSALVIVAALAVCQAAPEERADSAISAQVDLSERVSHAFANFTETAAEPEQPPAERIKGPSGKFKPYTLEPAKPIPGAPSSPLYGQPGGTRTAAPVLAPMTPALAGDCSQGACMAPASVPMTYGGPVMYGAPMQQFQAQPRGGLFRGGGGFHLFRGGRRGGSCGAGGCG